jgi:hypothetical protein
LLTEYAVLAEYATAGSALGEHASILGQDVGLPRAPFATLGGADRDRLAGILAAISAAA